METNTANLDCTQWDKATWQREYANYCKYNFHGAMTKREYYDFMHRLQNNAKIDHTALSAELKEKWTRGFWNAALWAKKHGCDMNGRLRSDIAREQRDKDALETALRAEDIAVDTQQRLEYLIERVRK